VTPICFTTSRAKNFWVAFTRPGKMSPKPRPSCHLPCNPSRIRAPKLYTPPIRGIGGGTLSPKRSFLIHNYFAKTRSAGASYVPVFYNSRYTLYVRGWQVDRRNVSVTVIVDMAHSPARRVE
jgi:hypothetical protein